MVKGHVTCYQTMPFHFSPPLIQIYPKFRPRLDIAAGQRPEIKSREMIQKVRSL